MSAVTVWSFLCPDSPNFQRPETARIFFWHFPCPMMQLAFLYMGCYFSLRYFIKGKPLFKPEADAKVREEWDMRANSALEIGLIFGCLTMVSGMLFSLVAWGALWQNDPKQTSYLLSLLIYAAYFALRTAHKDPEKRAANSAAYMLTAVLPLTFLILVYPRLVPTFHPNDTIVDGLLKGVYGQVTICVLILVSILSAWVYRIRIRVGLLVLKKQYGNLETGRRPAGPAVMVRPVRVSHED